MDGNTPWSEDDNGLHDTAIDFASDFDASPTGELLTRLVAEAAGRNASELLLRPTKTELQIFARTPKSPCPYEMRSLPSDVCEPLMHTMRLNSWRKGKLSLGPPEEPLWLRVEFCHTVHGVGAVLSFLDLNGFGG